MGKKRKIANIIFALLLCLLIFVYLLWGYRLIDSEKVYVRKAGRISLRMQIKLCLVSPESLVYLADVAIKHTPDEERQELLDLITSSYNSLSKDNKKIFVAGIEERFLDPPTYHHLYIVFYQWPNKLSTNCILKGLLSNNFDVRPYAYGIIQKRKTDFTPEELSHAMAKLLKDGLSSDDERKIRDALFFSVDLNLIDFLNDHKSIIQKLSKSKDSIIRKLARFALKKMDEPSDGTVVPAKNFVCDEKPGNSEDEETKSGGEAGNQPVDQLEK